MIVNIPTAEDLTEVSLRLYFKAWDEVVGILEEWTSIMGTNVPEWDEAARDYRNSQTASSLPDEWREYLSRAQSDLQEAYALIQQSQEIGLKARICAVSPFLLLRRVDDPPRPLAPGLWDFTDFVTIDAQALPKVHDTFCAKPLSDEFKASYDEIRRGRNKISHLGIFHRQIPPHFLISILQQQHKELYPGRRWMSDRLNSLGLHRWADMGELTDVALVYDQLRQTLPCLSGKQYRELMGQSRRAKRYLCQPCVEDEGLFNLPKFTEIPTAFRLKDKNEVECIGCARRVTVEAGRCWDPECRGKLLSSHAGMVSRCLTCCISAETWRRELDHRALQQRLREADDPRDLLSDLLKKL